MKKSILAGVAVLCMAAAASYGQNSVPYAETFEGYDSGSNILGSVWLGDTSNSVAVVTNITYGTPPAGYPITATHTNVMAFSTGSDPITNEFDGTTSNLTVVYVDTMIQPVLAEPPTDAQMAAISNSQMSAYFDTNGNLNVYHGYLPDESIPQKPISRYWTAITNISVSTGEWMRLTVQMNYDLGNQYAMFKVAVNGTNMSSSEGWPTPDVTGFRGSGGPWYISPDWVSDDLRIHSVILYGSGLLDDMVVTTNEVTFTPPAGPEYATNGVAITWMQDSGLTTNETLTTWDQVALDDEDGDGAPNWAEYYAGTHPTNPASKLVIVSLTYSNGLPVLKWIGTTNAKAPYSIEWSSNLMSVSNWDAATNNLPQSEGTNEVPLPPPVSNPGFLRVIVNTNAP